MRNKQVTVAMAAVALTVFIGVTALAQQDRYTVRVPDGLAFSEFEGYDTWQTVAVSETEGSVKAILGNPRMIGAYKQGIPENGKPFPEGSKTAKIEWMKTKNPLSPSFQLNSAGTIKVLCMPACWTLMGEPTSAMIQGCTMTTS